MNRISQTMEAACARHADRTALVVDGERLGYRELGQRIEETAARWQTRTEQRIGIMARNSIAYAVHYYALVRADKIPFLLDYNLTPEEVGLIAIRTGITHLLLDSNRVAAFGAAVELVAAYEDGLSHVHVVAVTASDAPPLHPSTHTCRFTSGTTGMPKCIEFSDAAVSNAAQMWVEGIGLGEADQVYSLAALSNGLAFNTSFLASFIAGATLHMTQGMIIPAHIARYIRANGITLLVAFPTLYRLLVQSTTVDPEAFSGVRACISAGAKLWDWVREDFRSRFKLRIADYYGIAETGPVTFERDPDFGRGLGTALPGAEVRILAEPGGQGEVLVRTASMATRYLNFPGLLEQSLDADGFYHSSDMGYLEEGRLFVLNRNDDLINSGGRKVDPSEVAGVVQAMTGVEDVVVFGVEDSSGEIVIQLVAVVGAGLTSADIIDYCRQRLAPYKVPSRIAFVDSIPRNAIGKPRMKELKARYATN